VPWTLAVVVPLTLAAVLIALRTRLAWALPAALGLVVGVALVLTESSAFWAAFFVQERQSYDAGPALGWLFVGWAVVVAAAVLILTRSPLAGRVSLRNDWRIGCALVVLASIVVAMVTVSEAETPWVWIENNAELVVLGLTALALTLLVLRRDQAIAGLVALAVLAYWMFFYLVRDYLDQQSGIDPPKRMTEIVCVVLVVLACVVAQAPSLRTPAANPVAQ
jgi:hypothetical protein